MATISNVLFLVLVLDRWTFNTAYVPSGYLGCYTDKTERILSHRMPESRSNTGDQCKQNCTAAGYRYAGTEYAVNCFCGNYIKNYPKGSGCTAKCPGNENEICGGHSYISIYDTKDNDDDEDTDSKEAYVPLGFLGCYTDKTERILSDQMFDLASNTGDQCKQLCKAAEYRYAGTEVGVQCFCGNDMKNYTKGLGCTRSCPGNDKEICGGTWHISIYDTWDSDDSDDSESAEDDNFCAIFKNACPPKWKCRNKKTGYFCRLPRRVKNKRVNRKI